VSSAVTRVVSGIQPTGGLHLGNLLGAILRWVRMQDEAPCLFFLADLHALTGDVDPATLRANVREMAAALIASGIDPARAILFAQSDVPEHSQLAWLLQCTARMGWLSRMTQFKDKSGKNREGSSVGLFTYPVLQAADILLYRASHVPVGEDQKQHIELARDIAIKFNTDLDIELFVPPEPFIGGGAAARVMSLRDGAAKMSKSDPSEMSRIHLTDSDDVIAQKLRKARTDPDPLPDDPELLAGRAEARNLVGIMAAATGESVEAVLARFAGQGFGAFKPALADALIALLAPLRTRLEQLRQDTAELDRILDDGAARARALAAPTLARANQALGLTRCGNA
jgi:tryptophanyl-tRNA synthetase